MKTKKGFTLIEVLITIAVLGIISGVGTVSYNSYITKAEKDSLCDSAMLFAVKAKACILNIGGWENYNKACKATNKAEFKKKFDFNCPKNEDTEDTCEGIAGSDFFCLNLQKKISGTKHQVIVHLNTDDHSYTIHSGTPASYEDVDPGDCVESPSYDSAITNPGFCNN